MPLSFPFLKTNTGPEEFQLLVAAMSNWNSSGPLHIYNAWIFDITTHSGMLFI